MSQNDNTANGYEVVAIDEGPDVIDDGDPCERCGAERVAGESSWIVEYAHGGLKDVCSGCASKLEVGAVDEPTTRATYSKGLRFGVEEHPYNV